MAHENTREKAPHRLFANRYSQPTIRELRTGLKTK